MPIAYHCSGHVHFICIQLNRIFHFRLNFSHSFSRTYNELLICLMLKIPIIKLMPPKNAMKKHTRIVYYMSMCSVSLSFNLLKYMWNIIANE